MPALTAGFETRDPSGGETGLLPVLGLTLSLPVFNLSGGEVGIARAEMDRAEAGLRLAQRESAAVTASAARERAAAVQRADRDRALLADAETVVTLSSRAYQEGAFPLSSVLEAQRVAREVRSSYIDDVVAARLADADFALATATRREP